MIPTHPITKRDLLMLTILRVGFTKTNLKTGGNVIEDYITITTWDKQFQCVRYHYVHKSSPNPVEEVKSSFPFEEVYENASSNLQ